jgi:hypothetical protein
VVIGTDSIDSCRIRISQKNRQHNDQKKKDKQRSTKHTLAAGRWFSPVDTANKKDRYDITEILLKVALNTITQTLYFHLWIMEAKHQIK